MNLKAKASLAFQLLVYPKTRNSKLFLDIRKVLRQAESKKQLSLLDDLVADNCKLETIIEKTDFGAGSLIVKKQVSLGKIAKTSGSGKFKRSVLYALCKHHQPKNMLELGTSLGFGTFSLALGNPDAEIATLEGDPLVQKKAIQNASRLNIAQNINFILGNFEEILPRYLEQTSEIDFVFLDGNHKFKATVDYFNQILPKMKSGAIIVVDDIRWSDEMLKAWNKLKMDESVKKQYDFLTFGALIVR